MSSGCTATSGVENDVEPQENQPKSSSIKWRIRPMHLEDIDECLIIWRQVELTEAHQTVASSLVTDPSGFYVAELDNDDGGKSLHITSMFHYVD